jgi:hypothetical protein
VATIETVPSCRPETTVSIASRLPARRPVASSLTGCPVTVNMSPTLKPRLPMST